MVWTTEIENQHMNPVSDVQPSVVIQAAIAVNEPPISMCGRRTSKFLKK